MSVIQFPRQQTNDELTNERLAYEFRGLEPFVRDLDLMAEIALDYATSDRPPGGRTADLAAFTARMLRRQVGEFKAEYFERWGPERD